MLKGNLGLGDEVLQNLQGGVSLRRRPGQNPGSLWASPGFTIVLLYSDRKSATPWHASVSLPGNRYAGTYLVCSLLRSVTRNC